MQAVILAGGKGTRLRPFTATIPKPLVPIGEKAVLEILLSQLRDSGVTEVILAVNHLAHLIESYFQNGEQFGLKIRYSRENEPLGTAAPLKLIEDLNSSFLVLNGDLLTTLDFSSMVKFHQNNNCDVTIGGFRKAFKLELGVLKDHNGKVTDYIEKPVTEYSASMGVYVMNRSVVNEIPSDTRFDLPQLILQLLSGDHLVMKYEEKCEWLDIGSIDDYERAISLFESDPNRFLKCGN